MDWQLTIGNSRDVFDALEHTHSLRKHPLPSRGVCFAPLRRGSHKGALLGTVFGLPHSYI